MRKLLSIIVLAFFSILFVGTAFGGNLADEGWVTTEESDPISGSTITTIARMGETATYTEKKMILVRCKSKKAEPDVIVRFGTYLGSSMKGKVKYVFRKDDSEQSASPVEAEWRRNTEGNVLFASDPKSFIDKMVGHDTFAARTWDHQGTQHTVEIDLTGLGQYMNKISSCR